MTFLFHTAQNTDLQPFAMLFAHPPPTHLLHFGPSLDSLSLFLSFCKSSPSFLPFSFLSPYLPPSPFLTLLFPAYSSRILISLAALDTLVSHSTTEWKRPSMLRPILLLALLALIILYFRQPPANSSSIHSKTVKTFIKQQHQQQPPKNGRTVAVGDLHSDLAQTLAVLRLANVVDEDSNWSGGHDTLVQTVSRRCCCFCRGCRGYRCITLVVALAGLLTFCFLLMCATTGRYCRSWTRHHCHLQPF